MSEYEALLLSMAIEGPVAFALVALARWPSRGALQVGAAAMVATAVTHPQMWALAIWSFGRLPYWPTILAIEALVVVVEAALIAWMARLTLGARRRRLARRQWRIVPHRAVADGLGGSAHDVIVRRVCTGWLLRLAPLSAVMAGLDPAIQTVAVGGWTSAQARKASPLGWPCQARP